MLLFFDGFETIKQDSQFSELYESTLGTPVVAGSQGRSLTAFFGNDDGHYIQKDLGASYTTIIIGFAVKVSNQTAAYMVVTLLDSAGGAQGGLVFNTNGTVDYRRGSWTSSTTLVTSTSAPISTAWTYVEAKVTISDTAGSVNLRLNGAADGSVSSVDTQSTTNANVRYVRFGTQGAHTGTSQFYYDDWYACDTSGAVNNDFLGPVRVDPLFVSADGANDAFVASSGSSSAAMVNELVETTDSYMQSGTVDAKTTFEMQAIPPIQGAGTIFGVMTEARGLYDTSVNSVAGLVKSGASESTGTAVALGASATTVVQVQGTDPATSALWTASNLANAEFGVKVTA